MAAHGEISTSAVNVAGPHLEEGISAVTVPSRHPAASTSAWTTAL
jgi:hypothetical protein